MGSDKDRRLQALEAHLGPPRLVLLAFERPDQGRDQALLDQAGPRDTVLVVLTGKPDALSENQK